MLKTVSLLEVEQPINAELSVLCRHPADRFYSGSNVSSMNWLPSLCCADQKIIRLINKICHAAGIYAIYYIVNILKAAGSYLTADFLNLTDDSNRRKVFLRKYITGCSLKIVFFPN